MRPCLLQGARLAPHPQLVDGPKEILQGAELELDVNAACRLNGWQQQIGTAGGGHGPG